MARKAPKKTKAEIEAFTHCGAKRANIPTRESEGLLHQDEARPAKVKFSRQASSAQIPERRNRNKDRDPQIVWQGKDEEDQCQLEMEAAPIYVQEKIHPQALIHDLLRQTHEANSKAGSPVNDLFHDGFNGLDKSARLEFYQHPQKWSNRMIFGDSLHAMASLAKKESLTEKVQCIYMDPPYGINFSSFWQPSTKAGFSSNETREPEMVRAFRDTWRLGINSYLSYLRDRVRVAHDLLTESGSIFIQISDENVHLVRCILDEIFDSKNFVSLIPFVKGSPLGKKLINCRCDFILFYAKSKEKIKYNQLFVPKTIGRDSNNTHVEEPDGTRRRMTQEEIDSPEKLDNELKPFSLGGLLSAGKASTNSFDFEFEGKTVKGNPSWNWKTNLAGMEKLKISNRLWRPSAKATPVYVRYMHDFPITTLDNLWTDTWGANRKIYVVETQTKVIQRCMLMTTDPGDLVLDPTCGSGTTAFVAEQWGRRWITIDTSRVALTLARARIMGAKFHHYLLQDSDEGAKQQATMSGKPHQKTTFGGDIRHGFVYKRARHVTLHSIVSNPKIDKIHEHYQSELESLLKKLNRQTENNFEEWEVPKKSLETWNANAKKTHIEYMSLRQKRQQEMNDSIEQGAEDELLVDKPFKAKNTMRVSGPFTMESLSPHRILSSDIGNEEITPPPPISHGKKIVMNNDSGTWSARILKNPEYRYPESKSA